MNAITIIGSGLSGYNLAKEIRKYDQQSPLTIVTADGGESYSKPMLSNALSKGKTPEQLVLSSAEKMANQLNADIRTYTRVESIDTKQRVIETASGKISFDKLVLAIGASQRKLPFEGDAADSVISVNDLDDYRKFRDELATARTVAIVGAGLIGCEFANDLISTNRKVIVIGSSDTPLDRLIIKEIGELLKNRFSEKGIVWQLGVRLAAVNRSKDSSCKYHLMLSNGAAIEADLVLSATGLLPNTELASKAGIAVEKGIVVDRYLETNIEGIYALGDCIEINGMLLPFVLPIMNCARALGKTLTGTKTRVAYPAMPVVVKTPAYPIVVSPPMTGVSGKWELEVDGSSAKAVFKGADDKLEGFILTESKIAEKQELTKLLPVVLA